MTTSTVTVSTGETGAYMTWDAGSALTWDSDYGTVKTWDTSYQTGYLLDITTTLALLDAARKGATTSAKEIFNFRDGDNWASADEAWAVAFNNWNQADIVTTLGYIRAFDEAFAIADAPPVHQIGQAIAELLRLAEAIGKATTRPLSESIGVTSAQGRAAGYVRNHDESFALADGQDKAIGKNETQSLSIAENRKAGFGLAQNEAITVAEALGRVVAFNRSLAENMVIADAVAKAASIPKAEAFRLTDELRRNANAVVSDLLLGTGDLTIEEFTALIDDAQPTGYGDFRPFMEGDHDYKNAIFRAIITAAGSVRPRILGLGVSVDVPDIKDSGTSAVAAGGSVIFYNRPFYAPPEVNIVLKGGAVFATPRVSEITKESFKVELFTAASESVAGSVNWKAEGF